MKYLKLVDGVKYKIEECINEFELMITEKHDGIKHIFNYDELWQDAKDIYDILLSIKNN